VLCCSRFGVVGDERLSGCSVQRHALVAEVEVADVGVVERLAPSVVRADVVAVPQSGELETFYDQLTDDRGDLASRDEFCGVRVVVLSNPLPRRTSCCAA
jgi:hypothetical protein